MFILQINKFKRGTRKIAMLFFMVLGIGMPFSYAQNLLRQRITIEIKNKSLEEVIILLQNNEGIPFSYSKSLVKLDKRISRNYKDLALDEVLSDLFDNSDLIYKLKAGTIVLQPRPQNLDKLILRGIVKNMENGLPIEYAGVRLRNSDKWSFTDINGNFSIQARKIDLADSIEISALGYEKGSFVSSGFTENSKHVVFLKQSVINLDVVNINASDFKIRTVGNHNIFSFGSIYIDTQGQQTALFMENRKGKKGFIQSVSYYLSDRGNFESPFRVRIYEKDTLNGWPGKDLFEDIVIAKPSESGWYKMDLSRFNIEVPSVGFFVAIEGIYPENHLEEFKNQEGSDYPNTISYGQRLGYSRKKGEDTWHFSLAHTWFQLKEDNFHVMISAEIQYRRKARKGSEKIKT